MHSLLLGRRQALKSMACGFGYLALADLANAASNPNPLAARAGHHAARARRLIFLFRQGAPSLVDPFDYKPLLERHDGEMRDFDDARTLARTQSIVQHRVFKSPWHFRQYGQCGRWVSDLFP